MNPQLLRIPEPDGPEAELLRQAGSLPPLSPMLRQQVLATCDRQITVGRILRAAKAASLTLALLALAVFIFRYFQPTQPMVAEQQSSGVSISASPEIPAVPPSLNSPGISSNEPANPAIQSNFSTPIPKLNQSPDIISNTRQRP